MVFLSGSESLHAFYCLFIYVLPLEIQLWRWECWETINWFNPTIFLCLSLFKLSFCDIVEEEYLLSELMCIIVLAYSNKKSFSKLICLELLETNLVVLWFASSAVDRGFKPKNFYDISSKSKLWKSTLIDVFHFTVTI